MLVCEHSEITCCLRTRLRFSFGCHTPPPSAHVNMHHMHMRPAEYRIQITEYRTSGGCGRQNTEYRIQNPGGPHPSAMQFPHLLGDSVCCGRIQNAGRRMQGYWKTPTSAESKVFENTKSRPAVSISPPATSPHHRGTLSLLR